MQKTDFTTGRINLTFVLLSFSELLDTLVVKDVAVDLVDYLHHLVTDLAEMNLSWGYTYKEKEEFEAAILSSEEWYKFCKNTSLDGIVHMNLFSNKLTEICYNYFYKQLLLNVGGFSDVESNTDLIKAFVILLNSIIVIDHPSNTNYISNSISVVSEYIVALRAMHSFLVGSTIKLEDIEFLKESAGIRN